MIRYGRLVRFVPYADIAYCGETSAFNDAGPHSGRLMNSSIDAMDFSLTDQIAQQCWG
jgi:hypothetical protein